MTEPTPPAICGARHESYPDTVCTEPPAHRMPHGGPLIIGGRQCGGAAWGTDDGYADAPPAPAADRECSGSLSGGCIMERQYAVTGCAEGECAHVETVAGGDRPSRRVESIPPRPERTPHACGNCEGIDPDTCLANPDRKADPDYGFRTAVSSPTPAPALDPEWATHRQETP